MTREWAAIYSAMLTKPKYRRLSPMGRGALLHIFLLAGYQSPEATWPDPDELREALTLDGFPDGVLDELTGLRWLDLEDGALVIHDWDKHQYAATFEVKKTWEADRKREWRRKKRGGSPSPAPLTPTRQDNTPQDIGRDMSPPVPDMSRTQGLDEVVAEHGRLFGPTSPKKVDYLNSLLQSWPPQRVMEGMRREHGLGATRRDICGRLEKGLKAGDKAKAAEDYAAIEERLAG